ncbi:hypothetical protein B7494_g534 [Chlorociboria aeruginascens]|nr:hypothetical protein B7494_g534 [Chlorociboria aeruginascens]
MNAGNLETRTRKTDDTEYCQIDPPKLSVKSVTNYQNSANSQIIRSGRRPGNIPASRNSSTPEDSSVQPTNDLNFLFDLSTSAEEQATSFFFRNYVLDDKATKHFEYLLDVYSNEIIGNALSETIMALGMAGLSNFWRDPKIMVNAQCKYNSALRLISSRLRDIEEAKADQTLISVMLLGLYETNTCNGPQSMKSWTQHISGAASLLNLRGKQQLRTPVGHSLFLHLRSQLLVNCLQRRVPVPDSISQWSEIAIEHETADEVVSTRLSQITIQLCNLRGTMDSFHDYSDPEHIILSLYDIDIKFAEWVERCPSSFLYQTVTLDARSEGVFSDHYHVYSNSWFATIWNHYRSVRILTNELILSQLNYLRTVRPDMSELELQSPVFMENQLLASTSLLIQLSHDICASVPYILGYSPNQGAHEPSPHSMRAVSGNLLLWPLYCAACTPIVSDMMCNWVAGRLKIISKIMGIRQAAAPPAPLADSISEDTTPGEFSPLLPRSSLQGRRLSIISTKPTKHPKLIFVVSICIAGVLLIEMGDYMLRAPWLRILEDKVCRAYYASRPQGFPDDPGDGSVPEKYCKIPPVQSEVAMLKGYFNEILHIDLRWFWAGNLFLFVGGGSAVLRATLYTMLADVASEEQRSTIFFQLSAVALVAALAGVPLAWQLMKTNVWLPVIIAFGIATLGASLFLIIPETLDRSRPRPAFDSSTDDSEDEAPLQDMPENILSKFKKWKRFVELLRHLEDSRFVFKSPKLIAFTVALMVQSMGSYSVQLLYQLASDRFQWPLGDIQRDHRKAEAAGTRVPVKPNGLPVKPPKPTSICANCRKEMVNTNVPQLAVHAATHDPKKWPKEKCWPKEFPTVESPAAEEVNEDVKEVTTKGKKGEKEKIPAAKTVAKTKGEEKNEKEDEKTEEATDGEATEEVEDAVSKLAVSEG